MHKFSGQQGTIATRLQAGRAVRHRGYAWPGNVREMENYVKRAVIMAEGSQISVEDLGLSLAGTEPDPSTCGRCATRPRKRRLLKF